MRLIEATTVKVHEFLGDDVPSFAILSHTWGSQECTLQQMENPTVKDGSGYAKISMSCAQALKDGLQWVWVDTCCIDKTSTAELSEAINSMFRWYQKAEVCYAYLSDISSVKQLHQSRWFTRGWTLQELVAPRNIQFYDQKWNMIGSKVELSSRLSSICGIEKYVLVSGNFNHVSIAQRMSWAAKRQTTRTEDETYCLLGIFEVNMPLLYGEGRKAFARLQEEIMKTMDDQSLFAWGLSETPRTLNQYLKAPHNTSILHGLFATAPSDFTFSDRITVLENPHAVIPPIVSNNGVRIELQVLDLGGDMGRIAVLFCTIKDHYEYYLAFPLKNWGKQWTTRVNELILVPARSLAQGGNPYHQPSACLIKPPSLLYLEPPAKTTVKLVYLAESKRLDSLGGLGRYKLQQVIYSPHATYTAEERLLTLATDADELHAVIVLEPLRTQEQYLSLTSEMYAERLRKSSNLSVKKRPCGIEMVSSSPLKARLTVVQPSFAILVGGTLASPWVDCMVLLPVDDATEAFNTMLETDKKHNLARACTTLDALRSMVNEGKGMEGPGKSRGADVTRPVAYVEVEKFHTHDPPDTLFANAMIELTSSNLVDRGLFLHLNVSWTQRDLRELETRHWWLQSAQQLRE